MSNAQEIPPAVVDYQRQQDDNNLRTLSLLNKIFGFLSVGFSFCFTPHLLIGLGVIKVPTKPGEEFPLAIFAVVAILAVLAMIGIAVTGFVNSRLLRERRKWTLAVVMAAVQCLWTPIGTLLGVFTIVVLNRISVKESFAK